MEIQHDKEDILRKKLDDQSKKLELLIKAIGNLTGMLERFWELLSQLEKRVRELEDRNEREET